VSRDVKAWVRGKVARLVADVVREELRRQHDDRESRSVLERRLRNDIGLAMDMSAAATSAQLVLTAMPSALAQVAPHDTLRYALQQSPPGGLMLEFGVATGGTLRIITEAADGRQVYGFDAFAGLPENWRVGFEQGAFAQEPPDVPGAELVIGHFDETLPSFVAAHQGVVTFLHCDADLYSSTRSILQHVGPRLRRDSIVLFDEYMNYPWWQEHEYRAWTEWTDQNGVEFEYIAFTWEHEQVAVRVRSTPWDEPRAAGGTSDAAQ
jgi:hypothetical protein